MFDIKTSNIFLLINILLTIREIFTCYDKLGSVSLINEFKFYFGTKKTQTKLASYYLFDKDTY